MDFPKTDYRDYDAYMLEYKQLLLRLGTELSQPEFNQRLDKLEQKYKSKVFQEDIHTFDSLDDLVKFFDSIGLSMSQESLDHERQHYEAGVRLGYASKFRCAFLRHNGKLGFKLCTMTISKGPMPLEHYKQITHAPTDLSEGDQQTLDLLCE